MIKTAAVAFITCSLLAIAYVSTPDTLKRAANLRVGDYDPLPTVEEVKLSKFQGQWYEMFRMPKTYESCEVGCMRFDYDIESNISLSVKTACFSNKDHSIVSHMTSVANSRNQKHTKFDFWVNGTQLREDYEVIDLDKQYMWALIGSNDRKGLWLLSRRIDVGSDVMNEVLKKAEQLQFDTTKLVFQVDKCKNKDNLTPSQQKLIEDFYMAFDAGN